MKRKRPNEERKMKREEEARRWKEEGEEEEERREERRRAITSWAEEDSYSSPSWSKPKVENEVRETKGSLNFF